MSSEESGFRHSDPQQAPDSPVLVNARFRGARVTGVQRYAHEVTRQLGRRVHLVSSKRPAQGMRGHLWEQTILPRCVGEKQLLWSPGNTGPVFLENQVVTIHDCSPIDHPEWFSRSFSAWYRFLLPRLARRARHVLTDSQFSRDRILDISGIEKERVTVVPLGVNTEHFHPSTEEQIAAIRKKHGLPPHYLLTVASFEQRKNLRNLLEAWRELSATHPDLELVVIGAASHMHIKSNIDQAIPRVRFLGYVDNSELPAFYSGATAFVIPSLYEGFGLPVLEALACGAPVAASSAGSLPEVLGSNGLFFEPRDPTSIASTLSALISDEALCRKFADEGLQRAKAYSWERTAEMTWETLQKASSEGK